MPVAIHEGQELPSSVACLPRELGFVDSSWILDVVQLETTFVVLVLDANAEACSLDVITQRRNLECLY